MPFNNITHKEVIEFITEHIIHIFIIPQTLTMNQGASFVSKEVGEFAESYKLNFSILPHLCSGQFSSRA